MPQQMNETPNHLSVPQDKEEESVEHLGHTNTPEVYSSPLNPNQPNTQQIHGLQKTHGNQYVARLMDNHKALQPRVNTPKLSRRFNITDKLQRIQAKNDISSDDIQLARKDKNPSPGKAADPTNLLASLDGTKTQWQASGQSTQGALDKTKTNERIEKAKGDAQLISQISLGIMLASAGLSFFGIGLPLTPLLVGLSAVTGAVGLTLSATLQNYLALYNTLNPVRPYAVGQAWGAAIDSATANTVSQLGNSEQSSTSSIETMDKQISDIQASKDRMMLDIDDAKNQNVESLEKVTQLESIASAITDPIKDVFGKFGAITAVITGKSGIPIKADKAQGTVDKVKEAKEKTTIVQSKQIMRTPKITPITGKRPVQRMIWDKAIRPILIVLKAFFKQQMTAFLVGPIMKLLKQFKSIIQAVVNIKSKLVTVKKELLADKARLEENENKAKLYQSQSDKLLKQKELEKQSGISGEAS